MSLDKKKKFGVSNALSRGLTETISVVENSNNIFRSTMVPLSRLELDPDNPRKLSITLQDIKEGLNIGDPLYPIKKTEYEKLQELANTIKTSGLLNPIIVFKHGEFYRVVAGERRTLAAILANKQEIDARVFNQRPSPYELKVLQWVENTAREDLTLYERLQNMQEIMTAYKLAHPLKTMTNRMLKEITGLSDAQISCYVTVLEGPQDIWQAIQSMHLNNLDKAALLAKIEEPNLRQQGLEKCYAGLSLGQLRKYLQTPHDVNIPSVRSTRPNSGDKILLGSVSTHAAERILNALLDLAQYRHLQQVYQQQALPIAKRLKHLFNLLENDI